MREFLSGLSARERGLLASGAIIIIITLVYFLIFEPVLTGLQKYRADVPEKRAQLAWMRNAALEVSRLRPSGGNTSESGGAASLAMIDKTAKQHALGKSLKRVEPGEKGEVKVWLEDAKFTDIMEWLIHLGKNGIVVVVFSADRQTESGVVNARLTLKGSF